VIIKWYNCYKKQYDSSSKVKNITVIWSSNSIPGGISKRIATKISKIYLHVHVHCSIIYKS
jgi:hypothetical protein